MTLKQDLVNCLDDIYRDPHHMTHTKHSPSPELLCQVAGQNYEEDQSHVDRRMSEDIHRKCEQSLIKK